MNLNFIEAHVPKQSLSGSAQTRKPHKKTWHYENVWWGGVTVALVVISLMPIAEMAIVSLEPMSQIESGRLIPKTLEWRNYLRAFQTVRLFAFTWHSLVVAGSSMLLVLCIALMMGFVLSRFHFRFRSTMAAAILVTQMIPAVALLLPIYVLYSNLQTFTNLHIIGSFPALILMEMAIASPLAVWLLISGLSTIPVELDEAAFIDGATKLGVLIRILVPMALPTLAAAAIFSFRSAWNDILFASVLTDHATRTLAIGLQEYVSAGGSGSSGLVLWNQLMGAALMSSIPVVVFFLIAQRFLVSGLTAGALSK